MEEKDKISEEYKKPLIEIDNDLTEMSKNVKIINSIKDDIEELISFLSNSNDNKNNIIISQIKDKYKQIKNQIKKFMNKKKFIYNFIDNEKLSKKNISNNKNFEDENENLLEENNKFESANENIIKMKKEITNIANNLEKKLSELKILEKTGELIEEIEKNEINSNNNTLLNQNQYQIKSSILNLKAQIYDEETKELEKTNRIINEIKKGTNDMKIISDSQGHTISNLLDEHNYIGVNIEKGNEQLKRNKDNNKNKNTKLIGFLFCLIILIIIGFLILYFKFKNRNK